MNSINYSTQIGPAGPFEQKGTVAKILTQTKTIEREKNALRNEE